MSPKNSTTKLSRGTPDTVLSGVETELKEESKENRKEVRKVSKVWRKRNQSGKAAGLPISVAKRIESLKKERLPSSVVETKDNVKTHGKKGNKQNHGPRNVRDSQNIAASLADAEALAQGTRDAAEQKYQEEKQDKEDKVKEFRDAQEQKELADSNLESPTTSDVVSNLDPAAERLGGDGAMTMWRTSGELRMPSLMSLVNILSQCLSFGYGLWTVYSSIRDKKVNYSSLGKSMALWGVHRLTRHMMYDVTFKYNEDVPAAKSISELKDALDEASLNKDHCLLRCMKNYYMGSRLSFRTLSNYCVQPSKDERLPGQKAARKHTSPNNFSVVRVMGSTGSRLLLIHREFASELILHNLSRDRKTRITNVRNKMRNSAHYVLTGETQSIVNDHTACFAEYVLDMLTHERDVYNIRMGWNLPLDF